ncbi:energy transducer TonB family protein [Loktanella sp. M215]|uniref:energy transducer TonB family protein n=1 Tax=Loktanella sp. M215 TaxID=2675431 RepID=UPI001EFF74AE|nr:TonB family protein [Loktanella sp. M215]MCF7698456.1 TonB family protein [Loktanella sp. M215]
MKGWAEPIGFGALALGLHVVALVAFQSDPQAGAVASGDGGTAMVSLEAADGTVTDMVADWDRPPEVTAVVPPQMPDATPPVSAPLPVTEQAPPKVRLPALTAPSPDSPALPMAPEAPEPVPEVVAAVPTYAPQTTSRPVERPARRSPPPEPKPRRETAPDPVQQAAPSTSAPTQRAAGQGGGANGGASGNSRAATASAAQRQSLMADWGGLIRSRIERRKAYPRAAGGAVGTVQVAIRVGSDGRLQALGVAASSGNAALDQAALSAVQRAGRFPAAPATLGAGPHSFTLPMAFSR